MNRRECGVTVVVVVLVVVVVAVGGGGGLNTHNSGLLWGEQEGRRPQGWRRSPTPP